jgi:site-specific DNA recombinase
MFMTAALPVGLYARVSTDRQAQAQTVDSQVAALRDRIARDAPGTTHILEFIDEGYSGTTLVRPALERLRDLAAVGGVELLYVHSPDRLARKYAHQALLLDEFSRLGVRVLFLNRQSQQTPEDELLVQVQGVIAEYERAKIIERTRRGRRHAAQQGSVSALVHAPYGYRYVGKAQGAAPAYYEVILDEARVVRQIFDWVGRERLSIGAVARRLQAQGTLTRTGKRRWNRGTIRQILQNPTYKGEAAYGRTQSVPWRRLALRAAKHHPEHPHHSSSVEPRAAEEWITIATPALVELALFAAVQEQLAENRRRKRQRHRGASALLQGLLVCGSCGYAFSARTTRYHTRDGHAQARTYYRCLGSDAHRYGGVRLCPASPLAAPAVEAAVWAEVCALLDDPRRVEEEYARRWSVVQAATPPAAAQANTAHLSKLRQGLARLIDSYTEGFISKDEFEPRITRLRQRIAQFEDALRSERDEVSALREMHLLLGRMEEFAVHVRTGLADANWQLRRDILRALVKRIDVTDEHVTVVFRVAAWALGPAPPNPSWQHWLPRVATDPRERL